MISKYFQDYLLKPLNHNFHQNFPPDTYGREELYLWILLQEIPAEAPPAFPSKDLPESDLSAH